MFITFEGLMARAKRRNSSGLRRGLPMYKDVLLTYEPGGSDGAGDFAPLLDRPPELWDAHEELGSIPARTTTCARLSACTRPWCNRALRPLDSTAVYQGSAVGEAEDILASIRQLSIGDVAPDLTILLDLDEREPCAALPHAGRIGLEQREAAFFARVRAGYPALAQAEPERFRASMPPKRSGAGARDCSGYWLR